MQRTFDPNRNAGRGDPPFVTEFEDTAYIESIARAEAALAYETAMCPRHIQDTLLDASPEEHAEALRQIRSTPLQLSDIRQLYGPSRPSDMTPMERFCVPSPSNDSCGYMWYPDMQRAGIQYASCESIEARAVSAANAVNRSRKNASAARNWDSRPATSTATLSGSGMSSSNSSQSRRS